MHGRVILNGSVLTAILRAMIEGIHPKNNKELREGDESSELFRGTLGFDFVFTRDENGKRTCVCVEINGDNSGILGVQDIPDNQIDKTKKIVSNLRSTYNPRYMQQRSLVQDLASGEFSATPDAKTKLLRYVYEKRKSTPMFEHAHKNNILLRAITENKVNQYQFIPEQNRPRMYHSGSSAVSSTGYWICKPRTGQGGEGILIFNNEEFAEEYVGKYYEDSYIAQELVFSSGADEAPEELKGAPASMRYLVDFQYMEDGSINTVFEAGYQRVSRFPGDALEVSRRTTQSARVNLLVQNKTHGAISAPASGEEIGLARETARRIIGNIGRKYIHIEDVTEATQ